MQPFKSVSADEFDVSPFRMIGKDWMLVTAEKEGKVNSMTASWGGLGIMWRKNVAYVLVRESRYTKEFMDASNSFSLSFFDHEKNMDLLRYMGKVSGRAEDKIKQSGVTVNYCEGIPYISEATTVMVCKTMSKQKLTPDSFVMEELDEQFYENKDYHYLYIGEIVEILAR